MKKIAVSGVLALFAAVASTAQSPVVKTVEILSVDHVSKMGGAGGRGRTWEEAKNSTGLVVFVKATIAGDGQLWTPDFTLVYKNGEREDRARCVGISTPTSTPEDDGAWLVDEYASAPVRAGVRYFRLLFGLERGVGEVTVHQAQPASKSIPGPAELSYAVMSGRVLTCSPVHFSGLNKCPERNSTNSSPIPRLCRVEQNWVPLPC